MVNFDFFALDKYTDLLTYLLTYAKPDTKNNNLWRKTVTENRRKSKNENRSVHEIQSRNSDEAFANFVVIIIIFENFSRDLLTRYRQTYQ